MRKRLLVIGIILLFICMSINPSAAFDNVKRFSIHFSDGNILYVGGSGLENYTTIQGAISNANNGDTVFVYDDSSPYYENVVVDKSINLVGENRQTTEIYSYWESDSVVYISVNWVNISGFTINDNYEEYFCGIKLDSCCNNISANILTNNWCGIFLSDSSNNNTIAENIIISSGGIYGISLSNSNSNNIIKNNTFSYNWFALYLSDSSNNNIITDNYFYTNVHGIIIDSYCINNTLARNTLINISCCTCIGIDFSSNNNIIIGNTINSVWGNCIHICYSNCNIVIGNSISNCGDGIYFEGSSNNIISCNNIINSAWYGITSSWETFHCKKYRINLKDFRCKNINFKNLLPSYYGTRHFNLENSNSIHHNNLINNAQNAKDKSINEWDNGYPSGGNYWDDYNGTDEDGDGIGDTPYPIPDGDNQDRYPLMEPWGSNLIPITKFTWTPILPEPNETIFFNASDSIDYDGNITLYEWDWDNDGIFDENHTSSTATHTYEELGYYQVTLSVTDNDNLTGSKTKTVRVGNQPPYIPSNPYPPGDYPVDIHINLSWDGGDPDPDDSVTYDVYFGKYEPPSWVATIGPYPANQIRIQYDPGTLEYYTTYHWRIVAHDNYGASTPSPTWTFTTAINFPPTPPSINGQTKGKPGKSYNYTFVSNDPEGENVYYFIYWGDSNYSGWIGPYASSVAVTQSHTWDQKGTFVIRAQAKDIYGAESNWGTLEVTMPRTRVSYSSLFLRFLEQFPLLQRLLQIQHHKSF